MIRRLRDISVWILIVQLGILAAAAPALHGLFGCSHQHSLADHSHGDHSHGDHSHGGGCSHGHSGESHSCDSDKQAKNPAGWYAVAVHGDHDCLICRYLQTPVSVQYDVTSVAITGLEDSIDQRCIAGPLRLLQSKKARGPPRIL